MTRIYRKDARGYYSYPLYNYLSVWLAVTIAVGFVASFINKYFFSPFLDYVCKVSFLAAGVVAVIEVIKVIVGSVQNKGLFAYVRSLMLADAVRQSLLNTMTLNLYKDRPVLEVPGIKVRFIENTIKLTIAKLPGMYNVDKLKEDVNASFRGRYSVYAITEAISSDDGTRFSFVLEDVGNNKTFIPNKVDDLVQKPYYLKLQEGLVINSAKLPHLAIWGQSGSGKTTVLFNIIAQCLSNNTDLLFLDGKSEFSSFGVFYPPDKIAGNNDEVLLLLKRVAEKIKKRQKTVADAVKEQQKLGITAFDLGLQPVVIMGDEIGSIVASMTTKEKKEFISLLTQVVQKGRSVGVFAVLASQSPAVDVLPQGIRSQFSTKILLGSASGDVQRMAFGEIATNGNVEKYQGYYMTDGLTREPQKYFVPDLFKYDLENLETFRKLYEMKKD